MNMEKIAINNLYSWIFVCGYCVLVSVVLSESISAMGAKVTRPVRRSSDPGFYNFHYYFFVNSKAQEE